MCTGMQVFYRLLSLSLLHTLLYTSAHPHTLTHAVYMKHVLGAPAAVLPSKKKERENLSLFSNYIKTNFSSTEIGRLIKKCTI